MVPFKWHIVLLFLCATFTVGFAQSDYDLYFKGLASFENGNYDQAIQHFSTALKDGKLSKEKLLEMRARAFLKKGNFSKAESDFIQLAQIDKSIGTYGLAQVYALQGDAEKATAQLRIHLDQYYKNRRSDVRLDTCFQTISTSKAWEDLWNEDWYNRSENLYADALYQFESNENSFALDILEKLLEGRSNNHRAYALRCKIYVSENNLNWALDDIDRAISIKKKQAEYYAQRSDILTLQENYKDALKDIQKAKQLDPYNKDYYRNGALLLLATGSSKMALEKLNEYLSYFPNDMEAQYATGRCLYIEQNLEASLAKFTECVEKDPGQWKFWLARGNVNIDLNHPTEAANDYSMALDLDPKLGKVYYSRAFAYQELNEKDRACRDFKKAFDLGFKDALSYIQEYCGD